MIVIVMKKLPQAILWVISYAIDCFRQSSSGIECLKPDFPVEKVVRLSIDRIIIVLVNSTSVLLTTEINVMPIINGTTANGLKKLSNNEDSSTALLIPIPVGDPEPSPPKFPKEPKKLFGPVAITNADDHRELSIKLLMLRVALIVLILSAYLNDLILAWIHDRVPETAPLPDLFFSIFPHWPSALAISEYLIILGSSAMFTICALHKYRWILLRRVFCITGLLYFARAFCMLVTQVPVADPKYYCSPKDNDTAFSEVILRSLQLLSGGGLQINGKHTFCGDYIYNSPRRYWPLHWAVWSLSAGGIFCILLSRGHYTIDVILAYYVTTRLFWLYHTVANNQNLKKSSKITAVVDQTEKRLKLLMEKKEYSASNLVSREFWFTYLRYMERNVCAPVPRRFEWPFSWPRFLVRNDYTDYYRTSRYD
uniref:Sphingomyelin synthase-like domain-containing protein n=1 Tax=Romanomermis culicivorax TaxID=13658 RepID=A0A915HU88_ROMCU